MTDLCRGAFSQTTKNIYIYICIYIVFSEGRSTKTPHNGVWFVGVCFRLDVLLFFGACVGPFDPHTFLVISVTRGGWGKGMVREAALRGNNVCSSTGTE